jgi:hypothetical protein
MKKLILVAVGVALVAGLAASLQPAEAACGSARAIQSITGTGSAGFFTPGYDSNGYSNFAPRGSFWSLGYGNATGATPPNNDSGSNSGGTNFYVGTGAGNWLENGYAGVPSYFDDYYGGNHWQIPGTDGCIDFDGSDGDHVGVGAPDQDQCNVILVDDDDNNGVGYFLLAAQSADNLGNYKFNEALGNTNVNLAAIPVPIITASSSVSATVKNVTVVVPCPVGPAQGVYANCQPAQNTQLSSSINYQLYSKTTAVGNAPTGAGSRDLPPVVSVSDAGNPTGWLLQAGGAGQCGVPVDTTLDCTGNPDVSVWLCASLVVDGFETTNCSANAVRVDCGPNLANPDEPFIKRDKPRIGDRPGSGRDGGRGGR